MPGEPTRCSTSLAKEHAITMLRQSVRRCAKQCESMKGRVKSWKRIAASCRACSRSITAEEAGVKEADDAWSQKMWNHSGFEPRSAAEATAMALAEGVIAAAHRRGRSRSPPISWFAAGCEEWEGRGNTIAEHAGGPGVHASDAGNAWRRHGPRQQRPQSCRWRC